METGWRGTAQLGPRPSLGLQPAASMGPEDGGAGLQAVATSWGDAAILGLGKDLGKQGEDGRDAGNTWQQEAAGCQGVYC